MKGKSGKKIKRSSLVILFPQKGDKMICPYCNNRIYPRVGWSFSKIDNIGQAVIAKRQFLNLSQQQLADKVGMDRSYISKIEKNQYIPSVFKCALLANILFPVAWGKKRFVNACLKKKGEKFPFKINFMVDQQVFKD
jgi:DNA-binding XRE family transcriptional regulator